MSLEGILFGAALGVLLDAFVGPLVDRWRKR